MTITEIFANAVRNNASDLFLSAGKPPAFRRYGEVAPCSEQIITREEIDLFRKSVIPPEQEQLYLQTGSTDAAFAPTPEARFRINFFSASNGPALVARPIRSGDELDFADLHLPDTLAQICSESRGIILVVGAAGNGKSTTMSAMLNYINAHFCKHILTLEDPIEYLHHDAKSLVTQRELDGNADSFSFALHSAMRESPDVIVIGEMRDLATVRAAVTAALSGHLVLSTLHTSDSITAIERIIDLYPEEQREQVASDLGMAMVAVVAQRLLPRQDQSGMIPALELLLGTPTVRKQIAARDFQALEDSLRRGAEAGMLPFNRSLFQLCREGLISQEVAEHASGNPAEFRLYLRGMESGVDTFRNYYNSTANVIDNVNIDMKRLLRSAVKLGASDLILSSGTSPIIRISGNLRAMELPELTPTDTQRLLFSLLSPRQRVEFEEKREIDFAISISMTLSDADPLPKTYRFRINGFFQRGTVGIAARVINNDIPRPEALNIPPQLVKLVEKQQGLILVTGPTGSGKSTTLASLIDHINRTSSRHIITIEDPIEYLHANQLSLVEQREVHSDTLSFATALKFALRQDPDIIMVGEMRDLDTISAALTAAETGHLVFATLHTNSAPQTIDRIVDSFPSHQQNQIRLQLAGVLLAVVSQRLLTRRDGNGRIAAFEIMVGTPPVQSMIRDGKSGQLPSALETGFKDGMITMRRALEELLRKNLVSGKEVESLSLDAKQVNAF